MVLTLRQMIEREPAYALHTARVLFNEVYKAVFGCYEFEADFSKQYHGQFKAMIEKGIADDRYTDRLLEYDIDQLAKALVPERDRRFEYLGAQVLFERYMIKDSKQKFLEVPQYFWMRIAMGICLNETDKNARAIELYNVMSELYYLPSSPTLFQAGTPKSQMSSCYLLTVQDDLHDIFKYYSDHAQLSKWSGGIGTDWSAIRAVNARIASINVPSQGVIPFLKIMDSTTSSINRSGKRRGAACAYLETWHLEIEEFMELRKNTGDDRRRTHDISTAHWIPDLFMKRVFSGEDWTLFSPEEVPDLHELYGQAFEKAYVAYEKKAAEGGITLFRKVSAVQLWRKMISMLFETGHPWITFKDPCNLRSPQDHVGVVHSSNLCTEITLNTSKEETAVCNLGSLNLTRYVEDTGKFDREKLAEVVAIAMRALDNVIDLNFYPTKEGETSNLRHRPVGMGIMGTQDVFFALDIPFDSKEAVEWSDNTMEYISYHAILTSSKLAKEKGTYPSYKGSKWDRNLFPIDTVALHETERVTPFPEDFDRSAALDWTPVREHVKQHGMRNSNCMAIAPTATIGNISGSLPSIEPIYKNLYVKSNFSGDFTVINRALIQDLKDAKLWNNELLNELKRNDGSIQSITRIPEKIRAKYKEAFEIDALWTVRHAAARGKWIDQSQSVNLFIRSQSGKQISDVYLAAWQYGLKTTYYLRTLGATSVEKATIGLQAVDDAKPASDTTQAEASTPPLTGLTAVQSA